MARPTPDMGSFWDARARENALFFVDNRLEYENPDQERFWKGGEEDLATLLDVVGIEVRPSDVVLDLGCGVGRLTRPLAQRAAEVIAIDVSEEMLARAHRYNPDLENVRWLHGDGVSLRPVPDATVDGCLSHVVFQHIPDPDVTLGYVREMGRVLRPGGWSAFVVSTDPSVHRGAGRGQARARAMPRRGPRGQDDPRWLGSAVSLEALGAAVIDGGMQIERLEHPHSQYSVVLARRPG